MGATCVTTEVTGHDEYVEHGCNALVVRLGRPARHGARSSTCWPATACCCTGCAAARWRPRARWPTWEQQGQVMAVALRADRGASRRPTRRRRRASWSPTCAARWSASARTWPSAAQLQVLRDKVDRVKALPGVGEAVALRARGAAGRRCGPPARSRAACAPAPPARGRCRPAAPMSPSLRRLRGRRAARPDRCGCRRPTGCSRCLRDGAGAARRRRGRPPAAAAPRTSLVVVPSSARAAAGTRRSRTSSAASRRSATAARCGSSTRRAATPAPTTTSLGELWRGFFGPIEAPVRARASTAWDGADVAVATGWQTVAADAPAARRRAAAPTSSRTTSPSSTPPRRSREWAARTYRQGLHCIAASAWLAEKLRRDYGARADHFDLGVDHDVYHPLPVSRQERHGALLRPRGDPAPRRAARPARRCEELHRRRPDVDVVLFGESRPIRTPFPHRTLGVLEPRRARAGLQRGDRRPRAEPDEPLARSRPRCSPAACRSSTSPSESMATTFGTDGPITLCPFDPLAIASALETLIDDLPLRAAHSRLGPVDGR